jgi:hypothetical protein
MRMSFKYSLRDIIIATLAIGLGIALSLSRYELAQAKTWQGRTYALQAILETQGFEIEWQPESESVAYRKDGGPFGGQPTNLKYYDGR